MPKFTLTFHDETAETASVSMANAIARGLILDIAPKHVTSPEHVVVINLDGELFCRYTAQVLPSGDVGCVILFPLKSESDDDGQQST